MRQLPPTRLLYWGREEFLVETPDVLDSGSAPSQGEGSGSGVGLGAVTGTELVARGETMPT